MCISLTCCSSQRSESAQSPVPIIFIGAFSRLLLPAWNHVCAVWSGPELEDNQPKRSCGSPTLIKLTGAVVLCRAGAFKRIWRSPHRWRLLFVTLIVICISQGPSRHPKVDNRPFLPVNYLFSHDLRGAKRKEGFNCQSGALKKSKFSCGCASSWDYCWPIPTTAESLKRLSFMLLSLPFLISSSY